MIKLLTLLRNDRRGATAVEFALLGPVIITLMLAVLQVGIALWSYNSLRSAASDIARYAVTNYQSGNQLSATQIASMGSSIATQTPYGLTSSQLTVSVVTATTQRVDNATEMTLTLNYTMPTILAIAGVGNINMAYSRPIFLIQ